MRKEANQHDDSNSEPLLVTIDSSDEGVAKSEKRSKQMQVHRIFCFFYGSLLGIFLQLISVLIFTRLVFHARSHGQNEATIFIEPSTHELTDEEKKEYFQAILRSDPEPWFKAAVWIVYNLSLGIYLIIWFSMMTVALSKVGWRYISILCLCPKEMSRRTCFLRTFFFINGFVQGSLIPWIALEIFIGNPSFDVLWMPSAHLLVFFTVVFVYDWMKNEEEKDGELDEDDGPESLI